MKLYQLLLFRLIEAQYSLTDGHPWWGCSR